MSVWSKECRAREGGSNQAKNSTNFLAKPAFFSPPCMCDIEGCSLDWHQNGHLPANDSSPDGGKMFSRFHNFFPLFSLLVCLLTSGLPGRTKGTSSSIHYSALLVSCKARLSHIKVCIMRGQHCRRLCRKVVMKAIFQSIDGPLRAAKKNGEDILICGSSWKCLNFPG